MPDNAERYLTLLRRCLTRELYLDQEFEDVIAWPAGGPLGDPEAVWPVLRANDMRIVRPLRDPDARRRGETWPMFAETMAGEARLANVQALVERALCEGVPGDLVETGVWRGGIVALMRAVLAAHGDEERQVWACDSFEGLPQPDLDRYPADAAHVVDEDMRVETAVPLETVKANIARYDLLDDRVRFLVGWFKDTLPDAPIGDIALLRLDGDLYESTMDALVHLEPKVAPGGFVIVDDYNSWEPCRQAVIDYRHQQDISDTIHEIDWTGVWWRKAGRT